MNNHRFLIIVVVAALLGACSDPLPEGVLDKKTMASILMDMHVREAEVSELGLGIDSASVLNQLRLKKNLAERNIPDSVYFKSYDYYMTHLRKFDEVYAIVIDSLKLREAMAAEQQKQDMVREKQ